LKLSNNSFKEYSSYPVCKFKPSYKSFFFAKKSSSSKPIKLKEGITITPKERGIISPFPFHIDLSDSEPIPASPVVPGSSLLLAAANLHISFPLANLLSLFLKALLYFWSIQAVSFDRYINLLNISYQKGYVLKRIILSKTNIFDNYFSAGKNLFKIRPESSITIAIKTPDIMPIFIKGLFMFPCKISLSNET